MQLLTVVGARPQFVKAAVVSMALGDAGVDERILHTGQHYDAGLSQVFFDELGIPHPDFQLQVGSGSHARQTAAMLTGIEAILQQQRPDAVLVYGDTNSTLAGALAAAKLNIPVHHVEAGLRSFNRAMPEEINRIVTDSIADLLFAPTDLAMANLRHEGREEGARLTGDVMFDAVLHYREMAERRGDILDPNGLRAGDYILATVHRASNTDDPELLAAICTAFATLAADLPVLWPVHPRTRASLQGLSLDKTPGLHLIAPVGYLDMLQLERHARLILTDSGGVQKEAFFQRVPCVTLRGETEWRELVDGGWNTLVYPDDSGAIVSAVHAALAVPADERLAPPALYGDGQAAQAIAGLLRDWRR